MKFFESFLQKEKSTDHHGTPQLRSNEMDFSLITTNWNQQEAKLLQLTASHSQPLVKAQDIVIWKATKR